MSNAPVNNSISLPVVSSNNKYVSVVIPSKTDGPLNDNNEKPSIKDLVFESQKEALQVLKKYKNSRFKVFDNYDDAFNFSLEYSFQEEKSVSNKQDGDQNLMSENVSFNNNFKGPANTDLAKFRKMIQNNELDSIRTLITNPRYLINSCETPVLLMEGPRYNAFHIACKANRSNVLQLILDLLKNKDYMKTLFHLDDDTAIQSRIEHIIDLYLNTPDKGLHDTPLHLSSKFGCFECVEILLNESQCMREMRNKNDKTAFEVICDRCNDYLLKKRIENLFYSNYYIPIIREDANVIVGEPQSLKPEQNPSISALAGPMPKNLAFDLYERLKSPRSRSKEEVAIRLSDDSKGIERIARIQCRQNSINWKEYWPFLDDYVDLTSDEGLKQLENHLKQIYLKSAKYMNNNLDLDELCKKLVNLNVEEAEFEVFYTAPSSPIEDEVFIKGNKLSDLDIDAALALQDTPIDGIEFPHITKWLDCVSNHIRESKKTKVTIALSIPNLNLSFNNSFQNSISGDTSIQPSESVMLKYITSPSKLIDASLI